MSHHFSHYCKHANPHTDLNKDGILTYNDFLWAKDKICYMSGWKIDSPKYQVRIKIDLKQVSLCGKGCIEFEF